MVGIQRPDRPAPVILHDCDTPICVRYDDRPHLVDGTQSDNLLMAGRRDRITNLGRLGQADRRGHHAQSLAIREAILNALAAGVTDADELAGVLAAVVALGDPYSDQLPLF